MLQAYIDHFFLVWCKFFCNLLHFLLFGYGSLDSKKTLNSRYNGNLFDLESEVPKKITTEQQSFNTT